MKKWVISAATWSMLLGACQTTPQGKPDEPPKSLLSEEASKALARAEADVLAARAENALWTPAATALKDARVAATKGDSSAVLRSAITASELARLGLAQTNYPTTENFD